MLHEWNNCATIQNERTKSTTKNMIRQWNEFKGRAVTLERGRLRVSLNKQCQLILNRVAHERMGSPEAVVLLYDERYRVVGLRPAQADLINAFPLKPRYRTGKNGKWGLMGICAKPFFKAHGIHPERTLTFDEPKFESGILELNLQTARELNG